MLRILLLSCSILAATPALAEERLYNRVDFQAEASREVANDLLQAVMSVEVQDRQPARLAQLLNATLNDALKQASAFAGIKAASGNQNTYPVYGKNNQLDGWRGHAEIRLEGRDFKAVGELIMQLQQRMQLQSVQFTLAPDTRAKIENELIAEAIKAFRARAEAIRSAMGTTSYRNVNLSIGGNPYPHPKAMMRGAMAMDAAIPAPDFAAGDSRMTIQVSGTIELQ